MTRAILDTDKIQLIRLLIKGVQAEPTMSISIDWYLGRIEVTEIEPSSKGYLNKYVIQVLKV